MVTLAPSYTVKRLDRERELHFALRGLFSLKLAQEAQSALVHECKALSANGRKFKGLGDLSELPVQTREVSEQIRLAHEAAPVLGMERLALVGATVLLQQQYKRVREKLTLEFFDSRGDALNWLRESDMRPMPNPITA